MCGIFSIINNVYNFSNVSSSFMKGVEGVLNIVALNHMTETKMMDIY